MARVLVSACLLGRRCRWDGDQRRVQAVIDALSGDDLRPVCPEEAGGLPTPRAPCDLRGGDGHAVLDGRARVVDREGVDRTAAFVAGARACLDAGADRAVLKARSPSCGRGAVHVDGRIVAGDGVFAALCARAGIPIRTEEDLSPGPG